MAKQTRTDKARSVVESAWSGSPSKRRLGYSRTSFRRRQRERDGLYFRLLRVCKKYGIKVYLMDELDRARVSRYRDGSGEFTASGFFRAPSTIKLRYRSPEVLAHELAHALDYQLGAGYWRSEVVATAVEAMVCGVAYRGFRVNVDYAARQGGDAKQYVCERERIEVIFGCIVDAM